jgi:hypothetical protein
MIFSVRVRNSRPYNPETRFSMSLPKEPEPDPGGRAITARPVNDAGRILRTPCREGEGYVRAAMREEFIGG